MAAWAPRQAVEEVPGADFGVSLEGSITRLDSGLDGEEVSRLPPGLDLSNPMGCTIP